MNGTSENVEECLFRTPMNNSETDTEIWFRNMNIRKQDIEGLEAQQKRFVTRLSGLPSTEPKRKRNNHRKDRGY
jgi:hypothetical protein